MAAVEGGIRAPLYLGGFKLSRGASALDNEREAFQSSTVLGDASVVNNGPYLYDGAGDLLVKRKTFTIIWDDVSRDSETLELLAAWPEPIDFCMWKRTYELFSGNGSNQNFTLYRRPALSFLQSSVLPNARTQALLATKLTVDGSTSAFTVGAADALGRTAFTTTAVPADGDSNVQWYGVPVFRVMPDWTQSGPVKQSLRKTRAETWQLILAEV